MSRECLACTADQQHHEGQHPQHQLGKLAGTLFLPGAAAALSACAVGFEALLGGVVSQEQEHGHGAYEHEPSLQQEGGAQTKPERQGRDQGRKGHGRHAGARGADAQSEAPVGVEPVGQEQRHRVDAPEAVANAAQGRAGIVDEGAAAQGIDRCRSSSDEGGQQDAPTQAELAVVELHQERDRKGEDAADGEDGTAHAVAEALRLDEGQVHRQDVAGEAHVAHEQPQPAQADDPGVMEFWRFSGIHF